MKFYSTANTSVQQALQCSISKSMHLYYVACLFQRISQTPGQNQQNGKLTQCRLPSSSFRSDLSIHPPVFLQTLLGFTLLQEFLFDFFSKLYISPWLEKVIKFLVLDITCKCISKSRHFYSCPQQTLPLQFLSSPIRQRKITCSPGNICKSIPPADEVRGNHEKASAINLTCWYQCFKVALMGIVQSLIQENIFGWWQISEKNHFKHDHNKKLIIKLTRKSEGLCEVML